MYNLSTRKGSAQERGRGRALLAKRDGNPTTPDDAAKLASQLYPSVEDNELANACEAAYNRAAKTGR